MKNSPQANFMDALFHQLDIRRCGRDLYFTAVTAEPFLTEQTTPSGVYHQTITIFEKIKMALQGYGAQLNNLVACTIHLKTLQDTEQFGLAFNDVFGFKKIQASVFVAENLLQKEVLISIDAHAYLDETFHATNRHKLNRQENGQKGKPHKKEPRISKTNSDSEEHFDENIVKPIKDKKTFIKPNSLDQAEERFIAQQKAFKILIQEQKQLSLEKNSWLEKCRQELARHNIERNKLKSEKQKWLKKVNQSHQEILQLRKKLQEETDKLNHLSSQNSALIAQIDTKMSPQYHPPFKSTTQTKSPLETSKVPNSAAVFPQKLS